jgi:hypothetical protein
MSGVTDARTIVLCRRPSTKEPVGYVSSQRARHEENEQNDESQDRSPGDEALAYLDKGEGFEIGVAPSIGGPAPLARFSKLRQRPRG